MKLEKLCNLKGAIRFGSCNDCNKSSKDDINMVRITFESSTSVCLCNKCLNRLIQNSMIMSEVLL